MQMNVPQSMVEFFSWVRDCHPGFRPFVVGGACRDHFIGGVTPKDFDFEVFGISVDDFISCAHQRGDVQVVGVSFGVMKFRPFGDAEWHDVAFPRRESKSGVGHKGFVVDSDPFMSTFEASSRRDFTMNSIMFDIFGGFFVDHHNGISDIRQRIIRPVGVAFGDDSHRFFRMMQFASRFDMVAPTQDVRSMSIVQSVRGDIPHISTDRIRDEFVKMCVKGVKPSRAFQIVSDVGFEHIFPEVFNMRGIAQDPHHHPEGDAFTHTMHTIDSASVIADREGMSDDDRVIFIMAMICHDMGKFTHTQVSSDGKITSKGHAQASVAFTHSFMKRVGFVGDIIDKVAFIVAHHMDGMDGFTSKQVARIVKGAIEIGVNPDIVWWSMEADASGRPPRPQGMPMRVRSAMDTAHDMAQMFDTSKGRVQGIVNGDMIKSMGFKPSPMFKKIIDASVDAQAEGEFSDVDGARAWVSSFVQVNGFNS